MTRSYGGHTWTGCLPVLFPDHDKDGDGIEWEISIELDCTNPGCPAQLYGPPENCYPAEGPEFELDRVTVFVGKINVLQTAKWSEAELVLGEAVWGNLIDAAYEDADENWEANEPDD